METTRPGSLPAADGKGGICEAAPKHQGRTQNFGGKGKSHSEQDLVLQEGPKRSTTECEHLKQSGTTLGLGVSCLGCMRVRLGAIDSFVFDRRL